MTLADIIKGRLAVRLDLAPLEQAWFQIRDTGSERGGRTLAEIVASGIFAREVFRQPPPAWLANAVNALREQKMSENERHRRDEIRIHHLRFNLVRRFLEQGMKKEMAYAAASQRLQNTPAVGEKDAVKRSYKMIDKANREGSSSEFYVRRRRVTW